MTTEEQTQIETIRLAQSKGNAAALNIISKAIGGPTTTGCFCSSTTWKAFYKDFFTWYDEQEITPTNE